MAKYFLESSALVKRYKREAGTGFVNSLFDGTHELFYLNLAIIEIRKIFYRLWKYPQNLEKDIQITDEEFRELESRFAADIRQMQRVAFTEEIIEQAVEILEKIWIRSVFDLAHLSAYLIAKEGDTEMIFVCSDKRSNLVDAAKQFVPEESITIPEDYSGM